MESQGSTVVFTVINGKIAGAFALSDKIRPEAKEATAKLREQGMKVYMLTGDSENVAAHVAEELGIEAIFCSGSPRPES